MKTFLKAGLTSLFLLGASAAGAADPRADRLLPPAPPLPELFSWTGFYAGGQIGYSWGSGKTRFSSTTGALNGADFSYSTDSVLGGGHLGFNYQLGSIVLGVEGDLDAMNARGGFDDLARLGRSRGTWQGTIRGRVGFALDRFMIYGTGGAAFTEFEHYFVNLGNGLAERGDHSRTGWTAGAGVSYAITDNLIGGVEYRYTDYGRFGSLARNAFVGLAAEQEATMHAVRTSLSYKF